MSSKYYNNLPVTIIGKTADKLGFVDIEYLDVKNGKLSTISRSVLEVALTDRILPVESVEEKSPNWHDRFEGLNNPLHYDVSGMYSHYLNGTLDLNPAYQRDFVWTTEQKQSYIQNLFLHKAKVEVHCILVMSDDNSDKPDILEVLDGKQRLSTIFGYLENQFPLPSGRYFKDLPLKDRNYLLRMTVAYYRISTAGFSRNLTLQEKCELFLMINELGTRMSDTDLQRVKNMMS